MRFLFARMGYGLAGVLAASLTTALVACRSSDATSGAGAGADTGGALNGGALNGGALNGGAPTDEGGRVAGGDASGGAGGTTVGGSDGTEDSAPTDPAHFAAAKDTAEKNATCIDAAPFYWEIGDVNGPLASGSTGDGSYTVTSSMAIASASKLFWGAYVVERFKSDLGAVDLKAMTMRSGYTSFGNCVGALSVQACFDSGTNSTYTAADDGGFAYGGGHFQKYAVDLGLGPDGELKLAAELASLLGSELHIAYWVPQPAGGMVSTPEDYAAFLRKILSGGLAIRDHLGENAVCTLPGASCPSAKSSPVPVAWHYSYGHWVEDDPTTGDGAFSSPGLYGFYPWIDRTKRYYGVLARRKLTGAAYIGSAQCGRLIRAAFFSGTAM